MALTLPTVHINGTSREELQRQNREAWAAINAAITALNNAAPHARDYYVEGEEAFRKAAAEHLTRKAKLLEVQKELTQIAYHLAGIECAEQQ